MKCNMPIRDNDKTQHFTLTPAWYRSIDRLPCTLPQLNAAVCISIDPCNKHEPLKASICPETKAALMMQSFELTSTLAATQP